MTADEMLEQGWATKRAADRRAREEFHMRWGAFYKCAGCGARLTVTTTCDCGSNGVLLAGYSWTEPAHLPAFESKHFSIRVG